MPMMVFDHQHCRWRPWHGTRAAWLRLPHAVATGLCLLGTAALPASAPVPARPAPAHAAPQVARRVGPPMAIFLPTPWVGRAFTPAVSALPAGQPMLLGGGGSTGGVTGSGTGGGGPVPQPAPAPRPIITVTTSLRPNTPRTPVPEPSTAPVLAVATLALIGLTRRRRHSALPPPRL